MPEPLLTIIVPTYNRSQNLKLLLLTLREETVLIADNVSVLVLDNASSDNTSAVINDIANNWPELIHHHHPTNIGAENNFLYAVKRIRTRWFWIIGDDDLPKRGIISNVLMLLQTRQPSLLYMESEWLNSVNSPDQGQQINALCISQLSALSFAKTVHVWITYISGMVINRQQLESVLQGQALDRYNGTSLVQLGWVLPMLKAENLFLYISSPCILATAGNTGGYNLLQVFGKNLHQILKDAFQNEKNIEELSIRNSIISRVNINYLPFLIRGYKYGVMGSFKKNQINDDIFDPSLVNTIYYKFILKSILSDSPTKSYLAYLLSKLISKCFIFYDRIFFSKINTRQLTIQVSTTTKST